MKTILLILLIFITVFSCNNNSKDELYSMEQIELDSRPYKTDEIVFITYPDVIFIKTDNKNIIGEPEYDDLITLHSKFYSHLKLNSFLYSTLNLKLDIPVEQLQTLKIQTFKIDAEVENEAVKKGVDYLIDSITTTSNNKKHLKRNMSSNDKDKTIEYFLYRNKFLIIRDDYSAFSWIEKKENLELYIK